MVVSRNCRDNRLSFAALFLAVATFFAPVVDGALHRVMGAETTATGRGRSLPLFVTIDGRARTPVKAEHDRAESLRVRFEGETLDAAGRSAIANFARSSPLRDAPRLLVVGGVGPKETSVAGFRRARMVRERLVAAGWNGDHIVVAGWQTVDVLPTTLGQVDRADVFVVVPLVEGVRVVSAVEGDPGRALALDSAYSRLATVSSGALPGVAAPAPGAAAKPVDPIARMIAAAPAPHVEVAPVPAPVAKPAPVGAAGGNERMPVPVAAPVRAPVAGDAVVRPMAARATSPSDGRPCSAPAIVMDDFYLGGPFRDCSGNRRVITR